ncbi:hypothetical protein C0431_15465 [bacterium]|nr:hypothetical protein [bacterium]
MTDYNIEFKDHVVENPNRFRQTVVAPGIVDLVPLWIENPTQVIQEGTPVNADLFEKLRANVTRRSETYTATANQTVFDLTKAYMVGQGRLDVYISGVKQRSGIDFTETSPTSFTLSEGLEAGTIIEAVYFSASQALSEDLIEQVQAAEAATLAASEAADDANDAATGALTANLNWKEPVSNLTALNALASPQTRDTRQTKDTGNVYRYDGTAWVLIQTMDPNAINALDTRLTSQLAEKASQTDLLLKANKDEVNDLASRKADKSYVDNNLTALDVKINSQASGSPKGVYATLSALQTAKPTGDSNIYVVTADGKWYYWNGSAWTAGGVYQSTGLSGDSFETAIATETGLKVQQGVNLYNKDTALANLLLSEVAIGSVEASSGWTTSDFVPVEPNREISIAAPRRVVQYDMFKNVIVETFNDNATSTDLTITTNAKTRYLRFSILTTSAANGQVKYGGATLRRYPFANKVVLKRRDGQELFVDNVVNHRYEVKAGGKNLYNNETATTGNRLNTSGSLLAAIGWVTSDFIEVTPQAHTITQARYLHQYDKYKNPIVDSYVDLGTVVTGHTFTPSVEAKFFRFSYFETATPIQVETGSVASAYEAFVYAIYADGRKVQDLKNNAQSPAATEDLSAVDYGNVALKKFKAISVFDDGTWIRNTGLAGTVSDDTTNSTYGTKALKMTVANDASGEVNKAVDLDISDKVFVMKLFIDDVANLSWLGITFFSQGNADYYLYHPPVSQLKTGWNLIAIPTDVFSPKNGTTSPEIKKAIKNIIVRATAKASVTVNLSLDMFGLTPNAIKRGKVVLQFDDAWDGTWLYAKPAMDKYGFRGTVYVIKDLVNAAQFMTLSQLQTLYDNGWDMGTHGQVELTTLATPEAIRAELLRNHDYLVAQGFTRSAKHYCTPAGRYNDMALTEIKKIFLTHRTTEFRYNALPVADRYRLGNISGNENALSFLKAVVDNTEQYKSLTILNWHQIVESGATGNVATAQVFRDFIDYLATKNIDVVTLSDIFNPLD